MCISNKGLRVASYNIRKAKGLDRKRDPMRILQVLNSLDADVIALQEADLRLGSRPAAISRNLIDAETDFAVVPVAQNAVSLGWHGNAVLVRKGIKVGDITHIDLPGLEPRGAVRVELPSFSFVAAHLGLMRRHRVRQLHTIAKAVAGADRVIVAGDFNEWSPHKGLEALDQFNVHAPGHSFHAARPIAALDRIAMSPSLDLRDAGVVQKGLARHASDHLPIWADVE
ncbi:endonuclease/exonuclease/phosphatase family protein [Loktanella sp. S4079]|uniref:endonuclease/exonuclease/phosphatase family protein n=1 Tax=Loktanella sp. S4079 TaxID=579483 RepID=UPI0005F9DC17|nr:endonuclease/exonuclease/phosphatase family protein [Loktanella sp. S4079]KJZ17969.1 metal-dependent hydrolase [Loktanella sp. S4079]